MLFTVSGSALCPICMETRTYSSELGTENHEGAHCSGLARASSSNPGVRVKNQQFLGGDPACLTAQCDLHTENVFICIRHTSCAP